MTARRSRTQTFGYNPDQWRNPRNGEWMDMPGTALKGLFDFLDGPGGAGWEGYRRNSDNIESQGQHMRGLDLGNSDDAYEYWDAAIGMRPDVEALADAAHNRDRDDIADKADHVLESIDALENLGSDEFVNQVTEAALSADDREDSGIGGWGDEKAPQLSDDVVSELDRLDGLESTDPETIGAIRESLAHGDLQSAIDAAWSDGSMDELAQLLSGTQGGFTDVEVTGQEWKSDNEEALVEILGEEQYFGLPDDPDELEIALANAEVDFQSGSALDALVDDLRAAKAGGRPETVADIQELSDAELQDEIAKLQDEYDALPDNASHDERDSLADWLNSVKIEAKDRGLSVEGFTPTNFSEEATDQINDLIDDREGTPESDALIGAETYDEMVEALEFYQEASGVNTSRLLDKLAKENEAYQAANGAPTSGDSGSGSDLSEETEEDLVTDPALKALETLLNDVPALQDNTRLAKQGRKLLNAQLAGDDETEARQNLLSEIALVKQQKVTPELRDQLQDIENLLSGRDAGGASLNDRVAALDNADLVKAFQQLRSERSMLEMTPEQQEQYKAVRAELEKRMNQKGGTRSDISNEDLLNDYENSLLKNFWDKTTKEKDFQEDVYFEVKARLDDSSLDSEDQVGEGGGIQAWDDNPPDFTKKAPIGWALQTALLAGIREDLEAGYLQPGDAAHQLLDMVETAERSKGWGASPEAHQERIDWLNEMAESLAPGQVSSATPQGTRLGAAYNAGSTEPTFEWNGTELPNPAPILKEAAANRKINRDGQFQLGKFNKLLAGDPTGFKPYSSGSQSDILSQLDGLMGSISSNRSIPATTKRSLKDFLAKLQEAAEARSVGGVAEVVGDQRGLSARTLVASAAKEPPAAWFRDPQLYAPTPLTVTDDGRIYGHLATWDICHIGSGPGNCITAPHSNANYAYFRTGLIRTAEGTEVAVGQLTLDTGHADEKLGMRPALSHYDNTGTAVADVAVGEDANGIWVAGALRPGVTPKQLRILRASPLSGDWREVRGNLELVAALSVNVQGFPIPRTSGFVASGAVKSLVAAGMLAPKTTIAPKVLPNGERIGLSESDMKYLRALAQRERDKEALALRERLDPMRVDERREKALALASKFQAIINRPKKEG